MQLPRGGDVMTPGLDAIFERYPEVMTVPEVAELLRMTKPGTYKWLRTGVLPGYKIEGTWFVFRDELKDTLRKGTNLPSSEGSTDEG